VLCAVHPDKPFDFAEKAYWLQRDAAFKAVDHWLHVSFEDGSFKKIYAAWFGRKRRSIDAGETGRLARALGLGRKPDDMVRTAALRRGAHANLVHVESGSAKPFCK
jgi:hypothetical protein